MTGKEDLVSQEIIESKIFLIRGKKIMLDRDLAVLYGVETNILIWRQENKDESRRI